MRANLQKTMIVRSLIGLTIAFLVVPAFIEDVQAGGMVVAPSNIVISNAEPNRSRGVKVDGDNTIKAIIHYPLETGCKVDTDQSLFHFSVSEDDDTSYGSDSVRYCYDDDNLIISFCREDIEGYLSAYMALNDIESGEGLSVVVSGDLYVSCDADPPRQITEESTIYVFIKDNKSKK